MASEAWSNKILWMEFVIYVSLPFRHGQVEKKAKAYIFLRDDNSQYLYKHGDSIEFLYRQHQGDEGKWCRGTFVRKCVGATHQAKIQYQHQQRDLEHVASLKLGIDR